LIDIIGTDRKRKLLTRPGSTPETKDGAIEHGNAFGVGFFFTEVADKVCGASKETLAIGSLSRISSPGKRFMMSLIKR
jgi:hypothetical protein